MKTLKNITGISLMLFASISINNAQGAIIFNDNFNTSSTPPDQGRVSESLLDTGWNATTGYGTGAHQAPEHNSQWDISGGNLNNPATQTDSYVRGETPTYNWFTNPEAGSSSSENLYLSFNYGTAGADTLTMHFWAVQTGGTPTTTKTWITNNQGWSNGNSNQNEDVSNGGYDTFNLLDGDTTPDGVDSITGQLNGTGNFLLTINVADLGIPGVSTVGDIDTFFIAFAGNETGGGTTFVDNLAISDVAPEPSTLGLLAIGAILLGRNRKRTNLSA